MVGVRASFKNQWNCASAMTTDRMKHASIMVRADWDEEAGVWAAGNDAIEGLVVEADALEVLEPKVVAAITDWLHLDPAEIPVHIMAEQLVRIPNPLTERMGGYLRELKELSLKGRCEPVPLGKGDQEIW